MKFFSKIFVFILLSATLLSCSEYQKLLKSTDYEKKWEKANDYYEQKKYQRVITLLEELQSINKGTDRAGQTLYMLANSYYNEKDYISAEHYFQTYYKTYPRGRFAEDCRFYEGKACYLNSPEARLSQEETIKAMRLLTVFLDYYPHSDKAAEASKMVGEMRDKLAYKEYLSCKLYYNLGMYMGNNYQSCIITATNTLLDYPANKYRENLKWLILQSKYKIMVNSVASMKKDRASNTVDEYYSFINEFPESKHRGDADRILEDCNKLLK